MLKMFSIGPRFREDDGDVAYRNAILRAVCGH